MPTTIPDLWPADFGVSTLLPPVAILRTQATALAEKTKGLVVGDVRNISDDRGFRFAFDLLAPALDDYRYMLFFIEHDINLYPVKLQADKIRREEPWQAANPDEFELVLKEVFSKEEVVRVVRSLISQSST